MSKSHILSIFAATLLGAFWVYPNIEKTQHQARGPASVQQPASEPLARPINRKKTNIKPMKVSKSVVKSIKRANVAKRARVSFGSKSDRRPTSLPVKKTRQKRDNVAGF